MPPDRSVYATRPLHEHRCDLQQTNEVTLPQAYLADWGINKFAKRRGLETAGMIRVMRQPGKTSRITPLQQHN